MQKTVLILTVALTTVTQCADQQQAATQALVAIATSAAMLRADILSSPTRASSTSPAPRAYSPMRSAIATTTMTAVPTAVPVTAQARTKTIAAAPRPAHSGTPVIPTASPSSTGASSALAKQAAAVFYRYQCNNCRQCYQFKEGGSRKLVFYADPIPRGGTLVRGENLCSICKPGV